MNRILVIGLSSNRGGVETFLNAYYKNMDTKEYTFDFISTGGAIAFQEDYIMGGSRIFDLPNPKRHPFSYRKGLERVIADGCYDVVHINMLSAANIAPLWAAKKMNVEKIIVHSHSSGLPSGVIRKVLHLANKRKLNDDTITKVACGIRAGKWMFGDSANFSIVQNAIDLNKFKYNKKDRENIRKKLGVTDDSVLLGNVGRLGEPKNQEFLLELLAMLDEKYKLMLVGDGQNKKKLVGMSNKLGIADRVIFVPNVKEIEKYYSAMDIFVFPSKFEGMPIAPVEAQVNGLMCIVSDVVTSEVNVGGVKFLPLALDVWRKVIASAQIKRNESDKMDFNRFDIKKQTDCLGRIYAGRRNENLEDKDE